MQYSITAAISLILSSNMVYCGPLISRQTSLPTLQDIADAQNQWASDTSKVSQFLSAAESLNPGDLVSQAATALENEKDELNHKAVLDNKFLFVSNPDENVQQANSKLVDQGTFMVVVNGLQALVDNGANMSPKDVSAAIRSINTGRCSLVLPSIDTYFQASGNLLNNGINLLANRPNNCPQ
ncbi:hypothetical protein BGZ60DRAFT_419069 [Tricladium varicosporioides]|nr:hypothetical protein BGZ60DRAFT_419069 [Hymenoscyphus varicosporioides]